MELNNKYNIGDLVNFLLWNGLNFGIIKSINYKNETWFYTINKKEIPEHYITAKI